MFMGSGTWFPTARAEGDGTSAGSELQTGKLGTRPVASSGGVGRGIDPPAKPAAVWCRLQRRERPEQQLSPELPLGNPEEANNTLNCDNKGQWHPGLD